MQIEKQILTYDLHSYSQELQQAILDGYRIVDQTVGFPQQIGNVLVATVVKAATDSVTEATPQPTATKAKKGNKPSNNEEENGN